MGMAASAAKAEAAVVTSEMVRAVGYKEGWEALSEVSAVAMVVTAKVVD